tara:strand:+ start:5285 stop:5965 length:681 start_codon:yes stop_codon:yes gene_type:complete
MKTKIFNYLTKPYIVILTMLLAPLFGFIDRNFVFFLGLGVAFLILWSSNFDWSRFGIEKRINRKTILTGTFLALVFFAVFSLFIDPVLQSFFGEYDLSSLEDIRGNIGGYIALMIIMWIFAALGEEFLFRGYYMKALAELLGNSSKAWWASAIVTSMYFGISHAYQGAIGVVSVFLWSLCMSVIFIKKRNNLLLLVAIHGIYDSIGITLLYLNKDHVITEWVQQLF